MEGAKREEDANEVVKLMKEFCCRVVLVFPAWVPFLAQIRPGKQAVQRTTPIFLQGAARG